MPLRDHLCISMGPQRRNFNTPAQTGVARNTGTPRHAGVTPHKARRTRKDRGRDALFFLRKFLTLALFITFKGFSISASCLVTVLGPASRPRGDGPTPESQGLLALAGTEAGLQEGLVASPPTTPGPRRPAQCPPPPRMLLEPHFDQRTWRTCVVSLAEKQGMEAHGH